MIECSKSVFHLIKTNLQIKILTFSLSKRVKARSELLLICQTPMKINRSNGVELWWMMIEYLKFIFHQMKTNLQIKFWSSAFRREWKHVQKCCWPVRFQWKLTGLVMINCDEWWLNVWMFEICIPPNKNGFTGQSFGLQPSEGGGNAFRIVFDLSGPNGNWQAWWWMEWWVNGDDNA